MSDVVDDLNAEFVALVQHATILYDIRQAELALPSEQFEVAKTEDHLDLIDLLVDLNNVEACNVTLELVTLIYELNNDELFLNLVEFNAPGCYSAMDTYDFAYECVSHLRKKSFTERESDLTSCRLAGHARPSGSRGILAAGHAPSGRARGQLGPA